MPDANRVYGGRTKICHARAWRGDQDLRLSLENVRDCVCEIFSLSVCVCESFSGERYREKNSVSIAYCVCVSSQMSMGA